MKKKYFQCLELVETNMSRGREMVEKPYRQAAKHAREALQANGEPAKSASVFVKPKIRW